jgi:hypothetical protein
LFIRRFFLGEEDCSRALSSPEFSSPELSSPEDCRDAPSPEGLALSPEGEEPQEAVAKMVAVVRKSAKAFRIEIAFMRITFLFF